MIFRQTELGGHGVRRALPVAGEHHHTESEELQLCK